MSSISFKFAKITQSKVDKKRQSDQITRDFSHEEKIDVPEKRRKITSLDARGFEEDLPEKVEDSSKSKIIPALKNTLNLNFSESSKNNLDDLARQALFEDAKNLGQQIKNVSNDSASLKINLNDLDQFGQPALESDYESMPIDSYGKALLRGLGWNEGAPIGRNATKSVKPWISEPRPKGLGLGAKPPKVESQEKSKNGKSTPETGTVFRKGIHVEILNAKHEAYGIVVSVDSDNARIFVQTPNNNTLNLSQYAVKIITKTEYEKALKEAKHEIKVIDLENPEKIKISKSAKSENGTSKPEKKPSWLHPDLKVRLVDKKYQHGRYYKQKMTICDVVTPEVCNCLAEDGKLLENLHFQQLESVVPKIDNVRSVVKILRGDFKGKLARLMKRDSKLCQAIVRLILEEDDDEVLTIHFDDICEFVGEVE